MFYLNHNDMEGMFRDAAKNYQINTDNAFDWERINNAVHNQTDKESKSPESKKNKRQRFITWVLLLISIGLFSYNIWNIELEKKLFQKNISPENVTAVNKTEQINPVTTPAENAAKVKNKKTVNFNKDFLYETKDARAYTTDNVPANTNNKSGIWDRTEKDNGNKNDYAIADKIENHYNTVPLLNKPAIFNKYKETNKSVPDMIERA